jgi:hypothetical protein
MYFWKVIIDPKSKREIFMKKKTGIILCSLACLLSAGVMGGAFLTKNAQQAAASSTPTYFRLYVVDNAWSEKPDCAIYVFGSSISAANSTSWGASATMVSYDKSYYNGLFSYDIPNDASFIIRSNTSGSGNGYQTVNITPSDSFYSSLASSKALKVDWNNYNNCTVSAMDLGTGESTLASVLSNTVTCSDSAAYGYNAYPQLQATIFAHTDASVLASTNQNVLDYDYTNSAVYNQTTHSYVSLNNRSVYTSIANKIARMSANYSNQSNHAGSISFTGSENSTSSIVLVTLVGVTGVAAAGAFFFFRKKHIA